MQIKSRNNELPVGASGTLAISGIRPIGPSDLKLLKNFQLLGCVLLAPVPWK